VVKAGFTKRMGNTAILCAKAQVPHTSDILERSVLSFVDGAMIGKKIPVVNENWMGYVAQQK